MGMGKSLDAWFVRIFYNGSRFRPKCIWGVSLPVALMGFSSPLVANRPGLRADRVNLKTRVR